mgnify:CR=1 FL=1
MNEEIKEYIDNAVSALIPQLTAAMQPTQQVQPNNQMQVMYDSAATEQLDKIEGQLMEQLATEAPVTVRGKKGGEWFFPSEQKLNVIASLKKDRQRFRDGIRKI